LPVSSVIGDADVAATRRHFAADLIARICDERLAFLKSLKTWPVFGKGWGRRVAEVKAAALAMADSPRRSDSATRKSSAGIAAFFARLVSVFRPAR
jgi:lysozyme family protein